MILEGNGYEEFDRKLNIEGNLYLCKKKKKIFKFLEIRNLSLR